MGQNANTSKLHRAVKNVHRQNPVPKKKRDRGNGGSNDSSGNSVYTMPVVLGSNLMEP